MSERYTPSDIEPKWQVYWDQHQTFKTPELPSKKKAYILDMFPYPSGSGLHVGHPEGYTATDIQARFFRALGYDVLHPMGWDAFGLPAEQHAIKTGTHPRVTTANNISTFKRQLKMLGFSYDWSREVDTTDPNYVQWTQWIFLQMFKRGLAYQSEVTVNWCPALGTVLANEEVQDGKSEVGGHPVERLPLRQWMLKITAYADALLEGLELTEWPQSTQTMQQQWIGRSEGAQVFFPLESDSSQTLEVYTTRPDTLFGATFMAIAPEHPWVAKITTDEQKAKVEQYVATAKAKSDMDRRANREKSGVFTGAYAINPLSGNRIPIWVADYVLWGYGTGAIMAVPAHDERDFEFAKKFDIDIVEVVSPKGDTSQAPLGEAFSAPGISVNSGPFSGLDTKTCKQKIIEALEQKHAGKKQTQYKLRDWVFSRQRYWGEPIPIYFPVETDGDPTQGAPYTVQFDQPIAVDESELPLRLPELEDYKPGDDPAGPLARAVDWRFFKKDGKWFARETNTMPQWAGSCWYYLRFIDPQNREAAWSKEKADAWLPVDLYVGGAEHAVLHLLYARFWHKVLFDAGLVSSPEPFKKLIHQGMILGEVEYTAFKNAEGKFVSRKEVSTKGAEPTHKKTGDVLEAVQIKDTEVTKDKNGNTVLSNQPSVVVDARAHKMSKSRGNVVNPDDIVEAYGADTMRVYEMFMGPLEATKPWDTASISGIKRFLDRAFEVAKRAKAETTLTGETLKLTHKTIRTVTEHIKELRYNTAISHMMVMVGELLKLDSVPQQAAENLALLLHPFAPHLGEEMWEMLGHAPSIQNVSWPTFDPALCEDESIEVPIQVNGKVRGRIKLPKNIQQEQAVEKAKSESNVASHLENKNIVKIIWVPNKILNFIAK